MVRKHAEDDDDRKLLADVAQHGWHLVGIEDDPDGPGYVFSVGIFHTLAQPEIVIFGLNSSSAMGQIVNVIGEEIRSGHRFEDWHESDAILDGFSCMFRRVDPGLYREYFGYALWFYEGHDFPMLQCVWPDRNHRYPWEPDFDAELVQRQPILAARTAWPFNEGKNRAMFTTKQVIEEGHPILLVTHDEDGDWQFLCGTTDDLADARVVSLGSVVESHPSVGKLADLPLGWRAERNDPGDSWRRIPINE